MLNPFRYMMLCAIAFSLSGCLETSPTLLSPLEQTKSVKDIPNFFGIKSTWQAGWCGGLTQSYPFYDPSYYPSEPDSCEIAGGSPTYGWRPVASQHCPLNFDDSCLCRYFIKCDFPEEEEEEEGSISLGIESDFEPDPDAPEGSPQVSIFSPRDGNGLYDTLEIDVEEDNYNEGWGVYVGEYGQPFENASSISAGTWNGHINTKCLTDNKYEIILYNTTHNYVVEKREFYVDNTPPIVSDLSINVELQDDVEKTYSSTVSFKASDPLVTTDIGTLEVSGITSNSIRIFIKDKNFGTPALDEDGFWITRVLEEDELKSSEFTIEESGEGFLVNFTVPYNIESKSIEVKLIDNLGNEGSYILNGEVN